MSSNQSNNSNQSVASSLGYIPYIYGQYVPGMMCHGGVPVYGSGVDIALYQAMGMVYTPEGRDTPIIRYVEYLDDVLIRVDNEWILIPRDTMLWGSDVGSDTDSEVSFHTADGFTTVGFWRCVAKGLGNMSQEDFNATLDPVEGLASPSHYITPPDSVLSGPSSPIKGYRLQVPTQPTRSPTPLSDYQSPSPHPSMPSLVEANEAPSPIPVPIPVIVAPAPVPAQSVNLMQQMAEAANPWEDIVHSNMWGTNMPGADLASIRNGLVFTVNGVYETCASVERMLDNAETDHRADQSVMRDLGESIEGLDNTVTSRLQSLEDNINNVGKDAQLSYNELMHLSGVVSDLRDEAIGWHQNEEVRIGDCFFGAEC